MRGDDFMVTEDGFRIMEWFFAVFYLLAVITCLRFVVC
jgi:hypothetical protein